MRSLQVSLSMEFFRQEYWSGLPYPSPGDLPYPRTEPASPALAGRFLTNEPSGKPKQIYRYQMGEDRFGDFKVSEKLPSDCQKGMEGEREHRLEQKKGRR